MKIIRSIFVLLFFTFMFIALTSCSDTEEKLSKKESSVYVYNLNGVAEYVYDDNSRVVEVITLDPKTLNEFITDKENYICEYTYSKNGQLEKLVYFGREFQVQSVTDSNVVTAVSDNGTDVITASLKYSDSGILLSEEYRENDVVVLKNEYDTNGHPLRFDYTNLGKMEIYYTDGSSNIDITPISSNAQESQITLQMNEQGYPQYMMQSAEGAMIGTTWSYDDKGRCISTLVESYTEGYSYVEEYEIFYNNNTSISAIDYYAPTTGNEPFLSSSIEYVYSSDDTLVEYYKTDYATDGTTKSKKIYNLLVSGVDDITTENYTDGILSDIENNVVEYNQNKAKIKETIIRYKADNTFVSHQVMTYEYGSSSELTSRTTTTHNSDGTLINKLVENYKLDHFNRVKEILYTAYDSNNRIIEKELDTFVYDSNGNTVTKTISMMDSDGAVLSKTVINNEYDQNNELVNTTKTLYDANGNEIATE